MNIATETREILRQYKALINARRRDAGQRELTTAQVMDEICEYMTCQCEPPRFFWRVFSPEAQAARSLFVLVA